LKLLFSIECSGTYKYRCTVAYSCSHTTSVFPVQENKHFMSIEMVSYLDTSFIFICRYLNLYTRGYITKI